MLELAVTLLFVPTWIGDQLYQFSGEVQAAKTLRADYAAIVSGPICERRGPLDDPAFDPSEIMRGRLYVPVRSVYIEDVCLDSAVWAYLQSFRYLESLTLRSCRIQSTLHVDFSTFQHLDHLDAGGTAFTVREIRTLKALSELKDLFVWEAGASDEWLELISDMRQLEALSLSGDVSDAGIQRLTTLLSLTSLRLANTRLTSDSAPALAELTNLRDLDLSETQVDDRCCEHLSKLPGLIYLYLGGTNITDAGLAQLGTIETLLGLWLPDTDVTDTGVRYLSRLPRLKTLDISGTRITNGALAVLATFPSLEWVRVADTRIVGREDIRAADLQKE